MKGWLILARFKIILQQAAHGEGRSCTHICLADLILRNERAHTATSGDLFMFERTLSVEMCDFTKDIRSFHGW